MKNINIIVLAILTTLFFVSCSTDDNLISDEANRAALTQVDYSLISPKGKLIANSKEGLLQKLGLPMDSKINAIDYVENESGTTTVALISYSFEGDDDNTAIAYGNFYFEADNLEIYDVDDPEELRSNPGKRIDCVGAEDCKDCRVQATYHSDGTIEIQCESSCCGMTVKPIDGSLIEG